MRVLTVVPAAAAAALLLAGCGALSSAADSGIDYKAERTLPPLEIPPDLTAPSRDPYFELPESRSSATLSDYQAERKEGRVNTALLPEVKNMRIERAGTERWLVVNEPADKLWPLVKDFWLDAGFLIRREVPEAGVIETDWAENRANIPGGMMRDLLGKVFESLHSTAERDKFRTRLERTPDGKGTEIFISHRGVEEVVTGTDNIGAGETIWQPRPSDPELEAEFLRRLMVRLGADGERAKRLIATAPVEDRAALVKSSDGTVRLQVNEPFDRAWRRVGLALDRVGFTVEDRDRQGGVYYVRYADPEAEMEKPGLFSRLFGLDTEKVKAERYRIEVREGAQGDERSVVNVLNKDGANEASPTVQRILGLLHEQLK
ncbi:MAG TPA: outer membrane protein assembly factor BamC [Burkholderiales bacterium]|nr:outer membrane protein assembly factor BamC [Burkholderiales bacterium]